MAYLYNIPNMSNGMDEALTGLAGQVHIFVPMFLLFVWFVVFLGGSNSQKKRTGGADLPMWATVSSLSIFMITLAMTITSGLVNMLTLIVVICVTILSGAWLFLDKKNNEV